MSFLSFLSLRLDKELNKIYIICIGGFMIRKIINYFKGLFIGAVYCKDDDEEDKVDEI